MENNLKQMEYPGRGIVIGVTKKDEFFCCYFVTGRSPSSQARKFVQNEEIISAEPTDPAVLEKGNPDLLLYNAIVSCGIWHSDILAVSNGKQTDSILAGTLCGSSTEDFIAMEYLPLTECTRQWNYEPDEPNYTPRISGRIIMEMYNPKRWTMELAIIRRGKDGGAVRENFPISPVAGNRHGEGYVITTYTGVNQNPLPSFEGDPFAMPVEADSAEGICEEISDLLKPEFRVSVASVLLPESDLLSPGPDTDVYIKNFRG